jgi:phosphopantetheinyl transferase
LLAQVYGGTPQSWPLDAPPDAPPQVVGRSDLFLSISHSGTRSACALAYEPIGLDLEQPQRQRDIAGLVDLCCTPREQALFVGLDEGGRESLFYTLWTIKEAWLKQRGEWISPRRLAQIDTGLDEGGGVRTWRAEHWHLAVTASDVRWWTPEPARTGSWRVQA